MEQKLYFFFIKFQHSITPIFHLSIPSFENQFKLYKELNFIPARVAEENKRGIFFFLIREFQLWNAEDGLSTLFDKIEQFALKCKFGNCNHIGEKGCAVIDAIITGIITEEKLKKLQKTSKRT